MPIPTSIMIRKPRRTMILTNKYTHLHTNVFCLLHIADLMLSLELIFQHKRTLFLIRKIQPTFSQGLFQQINQLSILAPLLIK